MVMYFLAFRRHEVAKTGVDAVGSLQSFQSGLENASSTRDQEFAHSAV